jgi:D-3-phosphoglycerate dehydrogenase
MRILITGFAPEWVIKELQTKGYYIVVAAADTYADDAKFCEDIKGFEFYISGGIEKCPASVIEAADKLKMIGFLGTDASNYVDLVAAKKKGVSVVTTPGANARAVAELTVMLMLLASRRANKMLVDMSRRVWQNQTGFELMGKTLGLIGAGPIAQYVAIIANGLGMKVMYWTRSGPKADMTGSYKEIDAILNQSDIISIHVPSTAGVILDSVAFGKLKHGTIIVNTCPAKLVDADALYNGLRTGIVSCSAFDGFFIEGNEAWNSDQSRFFELGEDRFFVTPHSGWRTVEADNNMFRLVLDGIYNH